MIVFQIIGALIECLMIFYVIFDLLIAARNAKYQKLWRLKKSTLLRLDPMLTNADLCEQYVMFCEKNDCKVEF